MRQRVSGRNARAFRTRLIERVATGIECVGAHGYMEDSNVPRQLRDAQVLVRVAVLPFKFVR